MQDPVDYLKELALNVLFSENATAFKACQVMSRMHSVVPERALKPLDKVKCALLVKAEIHRKIEQVQSGRPAQATNQVLFNLLIQLIRGE